jgi:glutathione S-transferase
MAKNIVMCFDGTWNGKGTDEDDDGIVEETNVLRLFRALAGETTPESLGLDDEEEREAREAGAELTQVAKYLHGVGDSENPIGKLLGGALGAGLIRRVVRGYTFVCRNYEPGDRIYIVGFSRGAYTARALGGMIAKAGLMDYGKLGYPGKEQAYEHGIYVWAFYRQKRAQKKKRVPGLLDLWNDIVSEGRVCGEEQMITDVPIEAIGVWDTVGALGIPVYDKRDRRMDLFEFADLDLSPVVKQGFHAMAIDDYRRDFTPTPWNPREGIRQVWFIGAHADVGGGYEERELSDITLAWMMGGLGGAGVLFDGQPPVGDPLGTLHDSYTGFYQAHPKVARAIDKVASLHRSYQLRIDGKSDYRPGALAKWIGELVD